MKRSYSTDLSDEEWGCLQIHAAAPNKRGRPKTHTTREILNAIFYVSKSGCPWRLLPRDLERPGRLFTGGSADGAPTGSSSGSTPSYARSCGSAREETLVRARASPTPRGGKDHRGGWRTERLRRRQEAQGQKAAPPTGGHREGLVLKAKVHSAKVPNQDGLRLLLLESARTGLSRLKHLWLEAG